MLFPQEATFLGSVTCAESRGFISSNSESRPEGAAGFPGGSGKPWFSIHLPVQGRTRLPSSSPGRPTCLAVQPASRESWSPCPRKSAPSKEDLAGASKTTQQINVFDKTPWGVIPGSVPQFPLWETSPLPWSLSGILGFSVLSFNRAWLLDHPEGSLPQGSPFCHMASGAAHPERAVAATIQGTLHPRGLGPAGLGGTSGQGPHTCGPDTAGWPHWGNGVMDTPSHSSAVPQGPGPG